MDSFIGFDSAWTDNAKAPGAICAVCMDGGQPVVFHAPKLVSFDEALGFIQQVAASDGATIVALDQPTVVKNESGMRPVERVAASLISWLGGGVQPANRGRQGMFCDASPIWRFIASLGASENPEAARTASRGIHLIEVFPALALASLDERFHGRLAAPRYNSARRKTFLLAHWGSVAEVAAAEAQRLGCADLASWCLDVGKIATPRKDDQDRLDAALCVLIALRWRLCDRAASIMIGDLGTGYMVAPVTDLVRQRLAAAAAAAAAAARNGVAVDGFVSVEAGRSAKSGSGRPGGRRWRLSALHDAAFVEGMWDGPKKPGARHGCPAQAGLWH